MSDGDYRFYMRWHSVEEELPAVGEVVIIEFESGKHRLATLLWDHPGFEDTYSSYQYFDDPENDGQAWDMECIKYWKYYA